MSARATAKEIYEEESPRTDKEYELQKWFWYFAEGENGFEDKPKSVRSSLVEDKALLGMVEQQPTTNTYTHIRGLSPYDFSLLLSAIYTRITEKLYKKTFPYSYILVLPRALSFPLSL